MIHLTLRGPVISADLAALREEFAAEHSARLKQLLSPDVMAVLARRMQVGAWAEKIHGKFASEMILTDQAALNLLHFLLNAPELLAAIREITAREDLVRFGCRVYRMLPNAGHFIDWHDDVFHERRIGLSINLSLEPYVGGVFQLRQHGTKLMLRELPNVVPGDANLFLISPKLEHRVTPVEGTVSKSAATGWFVSDTTDFFTALLESAAPSGDARAC